MSYTQHYLESESAAQGVEVSVLVNCLVQDAIRLGASDLHVEPWENSIAVRARERAEGERISERIEFRWALLFCWVKSGYC